MGLHHLMDQAQANTQGGGINALPN